MAKFTHLEKILDEVFGIFSDDVKSKIINAAEKDFQKLSKIDFVDSMSVILDSFNIIFGKRSRVLTKKVSNKYKEILKYYSIDDIKDAMSNAKEDDFHRENGYKYCTLEYFSRLEQIDKWVNVKPIQENANFIPPKFNVKEIL